MAKKPPSQGGGLTPYQRRQSAARRAGFGSYYEQRLARALARGQTSSQARGHAENRPGKPRKPRTRTTTDRPPDLTTYRGTQRRFRGASEAGPGVQGETLIVLSAFRSRTAYDRAVTMALDVAQALYDDRRVERVIFLLRYSSPYYEKAGGPNGALISTPYVIYTSKSGLARDIANAEANSDDYGPLDDEDGGARIAQIALVAVPRIARTNKVTGKVSFVNLHLAEPKKKNNSSKKTGRKKK